MHMHTLRYTQNTAVMLFVGEIGLTSCLTDFTYSLFQPSRPVHLVGREKSFHVILKHHFIMSFQSSLSTSFYIIVVCC